MATYQEFKERLLPGKYALTKSMELTKVNTSGTLWYMKKFVVLYYFVFLSNEIETREYVSKAIRYFDCYIETLDPSVQEAAREYFYPEIEAINLKSEHFTVFSSFAGRNDFRTQGERTEYYQRAKKCYFTLLMDSGGQKGVKRYIKEALQEDGFVYTIEGMARIILDGAVYTAIQECNESQSISDNSIKYILSRKAINRIESLSHSGHPLTDTMVREIISEFPCNNPRYTAIENDMVAFIRNERQILYYYGFFHSKSSGATDFEFSSLTPVGEIALTANSIEFQAIWEHQKIKMISQPATADIQNVSGLNVDPDVFAISFTPYLNILSHLLLHNNLSLEQYKFVISREDRIFSNVEWQEIEADVMNNLPEIIGIITAFGRRGDIKDEDFRKELLKYILGVRGDLQKDQGSNVLAFCRFSHGNVEVTDAEKLSQIYNVYYKLNNYKAQKYTPLFLRCEEDLRRRYSESLRGNTIPIDSKVKIDWDLFNIHTDRLILLSVLIVTSAFSIRLSHVENLTKEETEKISSYIFKNCPAVLQHLGLNTLNKTKREITTIMAALSSEEYASFIEVVDERKEVLAKYRGVASEDIFHKIQDVSAMASIIQEEDRARNTTLVSYVKSYYMARFLENNTLKCECCGEESFITETGEPYVEFHHLIPFNIAFGPDHYLNLFALCPNCHRRIHFLQISGKRDLYEQLSANNNLHICFTERLRSLRAEHLLRSYHLEYLLADNAITQEEYDTVVV